MIKSDLLHHKETLQLEMRAKKSEVLQEVRFKKMTNLSKTVLLRLQQKLNKINEILIKKLLIYEQRVAEKIVKR